MQAPTEKPTTENREDWKAYWASVQPQEWFAIWGYWRTEPEISPERQRELQQLRRITPDIDRCVYPFGEISLTRADIEWLLGTLDAGQGPVNWTDPSQRNRVGLDLRGVKLGKTEQGHSDLRGLPLACAQLGLSYSEWVDATQEQRNAAASHLTGADLRNIHLEHACCIDVHFEGASLREAHLEHAFLVSAHLQGASLWHAHLEGAMLHDAHLEGASLWAAQLAALSSHEAMVLPPADLHGVFFDMGTRLNEMYIGKGNVVVKTADIRWQQVNLAVLDWDSITQLGDESQARQRKDPKGKRKDRLTHLNEFLLAVRANRQLAANLREQSLNEQADRFAYRAHLCQRLVFRYQRKFGSMAWLSFIDMIAGFGYKPFRSFICYLSIILGFAALYFVLASHSGVVLSPVGAFVFSMTSFHGRGFFPGNIPLDNPLTVLAAVEAFAGLIIEVSFIATFTQRYFGK